jgi:hypothetical protein
MLTAALSEEPVQRAVVFQKLTSGLVLFDQAGIPTGACAVLRVKACLTPHESVSSNECTA